MVLNEGPRRKETPLYTSGFKLSRRVQTVCTVEQGRDGSSYGRGWSPLVRSQGGLGTPEPVAGGLSRRHLLR